jgi:LDH2 family malate/lactate/ureidoglycolate dehydrogenase
MRREMKSSQGLASGALVSEAALVDFVAVVLGRLGVPHDDAVLIASALVEADLRGVESHGVVRFPIYVERIAAGAVNPRPRTRVLRESATSAVFDGDNGLGHLVGTRAMQLAIDKGRAGACAFVAVRHSNHFGTASHFAEMAAAAGMIGLSLTIGGINHMVPWGGAEAILGNNPFAVAIPAGEEPPVTLDMACSVAARGKIIVAAKDGTTIPADWVVGPDGHPTTDPVEALKGFVQPVGGAKGYALTLTIGLLSTMLSGAFFGSEVTHLYEDLERPQNVGHLVGVLPVSLFEEPLHFAARMDKAIREVRSVRRAPGVERIYLPGERERLLMAERQRTGIPLATAILAELDAVGARYGVALEREI